MIKIPSHALCSKMISVIGSLQQSNPGYSLLSICINHKDTTNFNDWECLLRALSLMNTPRTGQYHGNSAIPKQSHVH